MSDEREFKIVMSGDAGGLVSAAKESEQALNQVKEQATTTGKEGGKAEDEAAEKVKKHALSHRQLHRAMHAVNELIPGLGTAMQFAFGAAAGSVAVLVMGIEALKGALEKIEEKYKEAAEAGTASWRAQQDEAETAFELFLTPENERAAEELQVLEKAHIAALRRLLSKDPE